MREALLLMRQLASEAAIAAAPYVLEAGVRASNGLEALGRRLDTVTLEEKMALERARLQHAEAQAAWDALPWQNIGFLGIEGVRFHGR